MILVRLVPEKVPKILISFVLLELVEVAMVKTSMNVWCLVRTFATAEHASILTDLTDANVRKDTNLIGVARSVLMIMNAWACQAYAETEPVPTWTEVLNVIAPKASLLVQGVIAKMWTSVRSMVINVRFGVIILQDHFVAYVLLGMKLPQMVDIGKLAKLT